MDTQQKQEEINNVSWKILVPCRILGVFFAVVALLAFFSFIFTPIGIKTFIYSFYIIIAVLTAYGFLRMRKWVITLLGTVAFFAAVKIGISIFHGVLKNSALIPLVATPFVIFGALFIFSYLLRSYFRGEYNKIKITVSYTTLLALSQILAYLYK